MFAVRKTDEFDEWFEGLRDAKAKSIILKRIARVEAGLFGGVAPVGGAVSELKIDFGPGYRLYFTQRGTVIALLCGGDKSSQVRDINSLRAWRTTSRKTEMPVAKTKTTPFDVASYLTTSEAQAELIADAFESGDPTYITLTLGHVARARGMGDIAQEAGVTREGLYKALSSTGDPRLSTLMGVMKALKLEIRAVPMEGVASPGVV